MKTTTKQRQKATEIVSAIGSFVTYLNPEVIVDFILSQGVDKVVVCSQQHSQRSIVLPPHIAPSYIIDYTMLPSSEKKSTQDHLARQTKARNDKLELQDRLKVSGYVQQQVQQKQQQLNSIKSEQREISPKPEHSSKHHHLSTDNDMMQSPRHPIRSQQQQSSSLSTTTGPAPSKHDNTSRRTPQQSPPRQQQHQQHQQQQQQQQPQQHTNHPNMTATSNLSTVPSQTSTIPSTHPVTTHSSAPAMTTSNIHIVELLEKERREWQQERLKLVHCIHLQVCYVTPPSLYNPN